MINELNMERDADASLWAKRLGMGESMFKSLPVGARFVFSREDVNRPHCVLVKTSSGYRHEIGGRVFKTGARTACFRLAPQLSPDRESVK